MSLKVAFFRRTFPVKKMNEQQNRTASSKRVDLQKLNFRRNCVLLNHRLLISKECMGPKIAHYGRHPKNRLDVYA